MNSWTKLPAERAHSLFKVPRHKADAATNSFYCTSNIPGQYDLDGPWPLIAFLRHNESPTTATFQTCSVYPEFIYDVKNPDPLNERFGGYLHLSKEEIVDLSLLVREFAAKFLDKSSHTQPVFKLIKESRWPDYHIPTDLYSERVKQYYYYQTYYPLADNKEVVHMTLFGALMERIRGPKAYGGGSMQFGIKFRQFQEAKLKDGSFKPFGYDLSRIELDRNGFEEFALLFMHHVEEDEK